jgi:hypothetical protein
MARQPLGGLGRLMCPGFTITLRHTTLGRTPLNEGPARRRDLYLSTHNTHKRQTFMPPVGYEPTIPTERPQTHALDGAATGIGNHSQYFQQICFKVFHYVTCKLQVILNTAPSFTSQIKKNMTSLFSLITIY